MNLPDGYFLQGKKYRLTHTIGQGGFGITYLGVWNTEVKGGLGAMKTTVPVCIKEYFFKDYCYRDNNSHAVRVHSITGEKLFGKFKEKLIEEANILSAVHHPNIVSVLEVFEENNTAYIIMEYIKGCSLKYLLEKNGILPEYKVIKYTHQIGNALSFVHEKNIVHLDIKPGNILIDQHDNARLIDFGVSKRYDIEEKETSTTTLTLSKGFAAIEQYDDEGMLSFSAAPDIYSLGATMYNLLTGVIPVESILRATKQMLPPSAYNSNITPKTEKAILKAMELKPKDRYRKVNELLVAIDTPTYEFSENTYTDSNRIEDDESTELFKTPDIKLLADDEEDKTVYNTAEYSKSRKKHKSRHSTRRRVVLVASILMAAFIGYAIISYIFEITSSQVTLNVLTMPDDVSTFTPDSTSVIQTDSLNSEQPEPPETTSGTTEHSNGQTIQGQPSVTNTPTQNTQTQVNNPQTSSTTSNQVIANNNAATTQRNETPEANMQSLTAEEIASIEKDYAGFISLGMSKKSSGDITGALNDFRKASEIAKKIDKDLEEVNKLIDDCKGLDTQDKKVRLDEYEIIAPWGDLQISRKKSTQKVGALNASGEIAIEFIYAYYTPTDNDFRAFYKDANNADVFDKTGTKLYSTGSLQ